MKEKRTKLIWIIFLCVFSFQMLFASGHLYSYDEVVILETAVNLVDRSELSIDYTPARREYTKPGLDGKLYSKFGIGMSALLAPVYAISEYSAEFAGLTDSKKIAEIAVSFSNAVVVSIIAVLIFLTLLDMNYSIPVAISATILLSFSTSLAVYGRGLFNDALTGLLLFIAFRAWIKDAPILCGLASGATFATRAEYVLIVPIFLFAFVLNNIENRKRDLFRNVLKFILPVLAVGLLLLTYNFARFGSPFDQGTLTEHPTDRFDTPLHVGLIGLLFSPGKGLLWFAPPIWLSILGIRHLYKNRKKILLVIVSIIIPILILHSLWHSWMGGWSFGPRRLIALLPLMMIPAAEIITRYRNDKTGRLILPTVGLIGFLIQFGGLTTNFMKYIEAGNNAKISVIWSTLYTPIAGQFYSFMNGERDLWYYYLFGNTSAADLVGGLILIAALLFLLLLMKALSLPFI